MSPDIGKSSRRAPPDEVHSMTMKAGGKRGAGSPTYDDYEDLLNTIEQENTSLMVSNKAAVSGIGGNGTQRRESH